MFSVAKEGKGNINIHLRNESGDIRFLYIEIFIDDHLALDGSMDWLNYHFMRSFSWNVPRGRHVLKVKRGWPDSTSSSMTVEVNELPVHISASFYFNIPQSDGEPIERPKFVLEVHPETPFPF